MQNVLIQYTGTACPYGRAVIADFGLSCDFPAAGEKLSQVRENLGFLDRLVFERVKWSSFQVGTTYFMSPECLKEQLYDEKVGFCMWFIVSHDLCGNN